MSFELVSLLWLVAALLALLLFFRIVRFLYYFFRYFFLSRKYRPKYDKETWEKLKKPATASDEIREKNKEAEQKLIDDMRRYNGAHELAEQESREIVGIAEPIGMWTKFVTQQKMSWLKAMVGSKAASDNFWQNIVQAQQQAQGKLKSRSR